jgi:hypothetical protein
MADTLDVARLREIQHELASAWSARDRGAIERLMLEVRS